MSKFWGPQQLVVPLLTENDDEVADRLFSWTEGIYLRGNKNVTGKVFSQFDECTRLEWIDVRECTGIAMADVDAYQKTHPHIRIKTDPDTEHP